MRADTGLDRDKGTVECSAPFGIVASFGQFGSLAHGVRQRRRLQAKHHPIPRIPVAGKMARLVRIYWAAEAGLSSLLWEWHLRHSEIEKATLP